MMKFSKYVFGILALVSHTAADGHEGEAECQSIVDVACGTDDFSTLCTAVTLAGLGDALSEGSWTVFAPTNTAFEELGDLLTTVVEDIPLLTDILLFHAVSDVVGSEDLYCTGKVEMANGQDSRTVCEKGKLYQKGGSNPRNDMPEIVLADIKTCQGYIHVVDEVMLPGRLGGGPVTPPSPPECQSIAEIACGTDDFSTLCAAVTAAGLGDALSGGDWTVFAPNNEAFAKLGGLLDTVLADGDLLTSILLFHAVEGSLYASDLECTHRVTMANGVDSRTVCKTEKIFQKGAGNNRDEMPKIIATDIGACNGVIHVVDEVMLP